MYTSWDFLNAVNVAKASSYVSFDLLEGIEEEDRVVDSEYYNLIRQRSINPEKETIKKEEFGKLSQEAREVISIIVNAPMEMLEMMTPKTKNITIRSLALFISEWFFHRTVPERKTKRVIEELKTFVRNNLED